MAARVRQAQAQTGEAASTLFPSIDLNGSAKRQGTKTPGTTFNTFGASLGASYELDFWGEAQDNLRAARNSARAALYAQDVGRLTRQRQRRQRLFRRAVAARAPRHRQ